MSTALVWFKRRYLVKLPCFNGNESRSEAMGLVRVFRQINNFLKRGLTHHDNAVCQRSFQSQFNPYDLISS